MMSPIQQLSPPSSVLGTHRPFTTRNSPLPTTFLPVATREARLAAKRILSYDIRSIIAGLFVAVAFRRIFAPTPGPTGPPLFETLAFMGYLYVTIAGAFKTFDTLAREKREGTLGLLLLTDLKPFQILFGKLLSASALTFFGLLAFLPILSLPIILGGVEFDQYVRLAASLITTLFLSITWGLYISAAARNYITALTGAGALIVIFAYLPLAVSANLNPNVATFPQEILVTIFTPALPFTLAAQSDPQLLQFFWPSILANLLLAAVWNIAALTILPHRCHETPGHNKFAQALCQFVHRLRFGNWQQRQKIRRRLLDANPLDWLSHRERVTSPGLIALCLAALILSQLFAVPQLGLFLASLAILFRMAHASSHAISEDQKNGALELILSTTLHAHQIVEGLQRAMLRRFTAPVALVIIWPWFTIVPNASELFVRLLLASSILLIATWISLSWVGPWYALRRTPAAAAWTTLAVVVLPPWLIWLAAIFPGLFNPLYADIQSMAAIVCSCIGVFHCTLITRWAKDMLRKNFREAAADPFATLKFEPALSPEFLGSTDLTVVPIGKGEVRVSRIGRTIRLFAVPMENHTFVEWGGHTRGNENPLHLELQGNAYIIARFAGIPSPVREREG